MFVRKKRFQELENTVKMMQRRLNTADRRYEARRTIDRAQKLGYSITMLGDNGNWILAKGDSVCLYDVSKGHVDLYLDHQQCDKGDSNVKS